MNLAEQFQSYFRRGAQQKRKYDELNGQKIDYAYSIFWTKIAREWNTERKDLMAERVDAVIASPEFQNNPLKRVYFIEGLDEFEHAGASLLALQKVLAAFKNIE